MEHLLVAKIALIGGLGLGAQWLAWRFHLPAIVLLAAAGLLAGPVLGLLHPAEDFGGLLRPLIGVAVAVILFEGGLSLSVRELREAGEAVRRLVFAGVPAGWLLGAAAAHYLAGLSWPIALLFGGILVVTGPTVIMPLLRQAKLDSQTASVLKWEGIINDPVGALLAVLVFEYVTVPAEPGPLGAAVASLLLAVLVSAAFGFAAGRLFAAAFERGFVAEFLKGPAILGVVLVCYAAGNLLHQEAGLVAVTVLGATLANTALASIDEMRRLKEYLTVLLVSGVFVLLSATLEPSVLAVVDWRWAAFLGAVLFVVRPLTVLLSTPGTDLDWRQRAFLGWIAPRGIVVVAVTGLFAPVLVEHGYEDAALLVPLSFAVVFATVAAHGFSIGWIGRRLGLAAGPEHGVLVVGATPWTIPLARALEDLDIPVLVSDTNWHHLNEAERAGLSVFYCEILSEVGGHHLDLNRFEHLLAATDNDAYNALVCNAFAPELGRERVFQLSGQEGDEDDPRALRPALRGRTLLASGLGYDELCERLRSGWRFRTAEVDEENAGSFASEAEDDGALPVMLRRPEGEIAFNGATRPFEPEPGDVVLLFAPARSGERGGEAASAERAAS